MIEMVGRHLSKHGRSMRTSLASAMFLTLCVIPTLTGCSKAEQASAPEQPPVNELQIRHDRLYAQAMKSFVAPATNSMLDIITKNNVSQSGTVDFIGHDKVVLDIGGRKHTYNRDWLSPQSREAILAPDYAEAFVRNTFKAEHDKIENDKAKRIREENERNEEARLKREEAERLRAEQEQTERWKAKSAALKAEKEEARRYNEELQRRADESAARRYAQAESQRQAERQAQIAAQKVRYLGDMPAREEAAIAYASRISRLVGGAAGLEYQLNQMIEAAKQYQDIAEYSTDWNQQVQALRKAEALIRSIPQIKREYYDAENTLISLRARDGQLFDDAMRVAISTPEVDPIIRAYCRGLIGE